MSVQALTCAFAIRGLGPSEKLVLLALANFANEEMRCWPSQERLADDTELSARTVWTALQSLETKGVLSRQARKRADGSRTTDVFTLHFALTITSEPTRNICEAESQDLRVPLAAVARLTTFEPSIEPSSEANASADPNQKAWGEMLGLLVGAGGMTVPAAKTFFGGLLKASGIEARELLGAIGEGYSNGTNDPKAWLSAAAKARANRRQTGPPKRVGWV
jgi:hypothetical protein